jgi:cytochrome bd ubiquinol oxidase subunit II
MKTVADQFAEGEGLFVFPLMLVYTAVSYSVFRGKVDSTSRHY